MKAVEIIGKGFSIAQKNLGLIIVLFVFNALWNIVTALLGGPAPDLTNSQLNARLAIITVIFVLANIFIQGGLLGTLKDTAGTDTGAQLSNFAKYGKKFYLRFLSLAIFVILIVGLGALVIGLIVSIPLALKNMAVNIIAGLISLLAAGIGLYFLFLIFLSPYSIVVDDAGIFKSMRNSICFIRKSILRTIGLLVLLGLIGLGIAFVLGIIIGLLTVALKLGGTTAQLLAGIISSAVNSYITVVISAALILYYSSSAVLLQKKEDVISA